MNITAESHMLFIILSFEYKKKPKEACELGSTGRSATVNSIYAGSKSVPHKEKCQSACYVKSSIQC